jgi:DNA (cytosine-5)-methyltransferase 1
MKACGYQVEARLLDAQWLGVPQIRQRLIFIGIRDDLGMRPIFPKPLAYRYSVREALPWIDRIYIGAESTRAASFGPMSTILASDGGRPTSSFDQGFGRVQMIIGNDAFEPKFGGIDQPSPTLMAGGARTSGIFKQQNECRKFTIAELRRICGFPDDFILRGSYSEQWERLGNAVPPIMMAHIAANIRDRILGQIATRPDGTPFGAMSGQPTAIPADA